MSNKIDKKLSNILGRAALEPGVNHLAMKMLRRYAMNFEVMHKSRDGVHFGEEVKKLCYPESYTRYIETHTDMQTGRTKSSFSVEALEITMRDPEWNNFVAKLNNLVSQIVRAYWNEMNKAILGHLKAEKRLQAKSMTNAAQAAQTQSPTGS